MALPVELTTPAIKILPLTVFPVTVKLPNVPSCVKLDIVTLAFKVLPLKALALGFPPPEIPVRKAPLPKT